MLRAVAAAQPALDHSKRLGPAPSLGLSSSRRSPSVLKLFPRRGRYFAQAHLQLLPGMITVRFGPRQPPCRGRFFLVVVLAGAFPLQFLRRLVMIKGMAVRETPLELARG